MQQRILRGLDGWWLVTPARAALLPHSAVEEGMLTDEVREALQERDFFAAPARPFAITVLTATNCNLGCAYCFQNLAEPVLNPFAPARIEAASLTPERIRKVTTFVERRMRDLDRDAVSLLIFGGEPLLNPAGCELLLRALRPLNLVHGEMISNAVLLTADLAASLFESGLRRVQVTFDGARSEHDRIRIDRRGGPTYDKIIDNVRAAARSTSLEWHFRVNVSRHNVNNLGTLVEDLAEIAHLARCSLHVALIDDVGIGYQCTLDYSDNLLQEFTRLIDLAMDAGIDVPLTGGGLQNCPYCSGFAGASGAVVNADGTLYSCWEIAGRPEWAVGNVDDGYLPAEQIRDRWVACDVLAEPHGGPESTRRFHDRVDTFILERRRQRQLQRSNVANLE